jgi:hypothetical protein
VEKRPKSRFEDENGSLDWTKVETQPEYPEVVEWDRNYASISDGVSALAAEVMGARRWGRWFLDKDGLRTRINTPKIGEDGFQARGSYCISLDRLEEDWGEHLKEKRWIGEKGLEDLRLAISELMAEAPPLHAG